MKKIILTLLLGGFSECCSKKPSTHSSCPDLPLRRLRLHRPRSLEISCFNAAVFLL